MASPTIFETLPDEILMLIFRYAGSVYSIFRSFSGLNQRFNGILIDRRLHLLTDFLSIDARASSFNDYYESPDFTTLARRLGSLKSDKDHGSELRRSLELLVSFHIRERYRQAEQHFRSDRQRFQTARAKLTDEEIRLHDESLKTNFMNFPADSRTFQSIRQMQSLVFQTGARLVCSDNELGEYNLTQAINQWMLFHISSHPLPKQFCLRSFLDFFQALLVSNPSLVKNKDYVGNGGCTVHFFLVCWIYRLQDFYSSSAPTSMNMRRYQAVIDLLLFVIVCSRDCFDDNSWARDCLFDCLRWMTSMKNDMGEQIIIATSQQIILKILFDEMAREQLDWDEQFDASMLAGFLNLVRTGQFDMILFIDRQNHFLSDFLDRGDNGRRLLDMMTGNRAGRQLFQRLMDEKPLLPWLANAKLLFVLLEKKECQSIRKLVRTVPTLLHRLDEDGNDPLLFVCLKVGGCRHRLVKFLLAMGSDWQRRNAAGEHFIQALQHRKNRTLLERLLENDTIVMDSVTEEFRVPPIEEQVAVVSPFPTQSECHFSADDR